MAIPRIQPVRATIAVVSEGSVPMGMVSARQISCSCSSGNCSLQSKSVPFAGTAYWCEGNCDGTCTLSASNTIFNGGHEFLEIVGQTECVKW